MPTKHLCVLIHIGIWVRLVPFKPSLFSYWPFQDGASFVDLICYLSRDMRFPTMWFVRPAKPQISLRIRAVWSEPLLVPCIFYELLATDWTTFVASKPKRRLQHRLVWVYTCRNATLLDVTCRSSNFVFAMSVSCSLDDTCWERAKILALLYVMFSCVFVTFSQVWYMIVSFLIFGFFLALSYEKLFERKSDIVRNGLMLIEGY